jgi:hypothetical protein
MKDAGREKRYSSSAWSLFSMCALVAVAILFNFFPDKVGSIRSASGSVRFVSLLAPEFAGFLPRLNIWWGLGFALHAARLILGRWTVHMRWADVAAHLLGAAVLGSMARADPFLNVSEVPADLRWLLALGSLGLLAAAGLRVQKLLTIKPIIFHWDQGEPALPSEGKGAGR